MASRFGLECDQEGFLIGTPVDLGDTAQTLEAIAEDVAAIRASMARNVSGVEQQAERAPIIHVATPALPPAPEAHVEVDVAVDVSLPRMRRDAAGLGSSSTENSQNTQNTQNTGEPDTTTATPRQRDARGRFTGAQGAPGEAAAQQQREDRRFKELGDRITGALDEPPEIDPFIAAYNEVARPVGRVMKSLAGDEKKQETWLKKIWRALTDPTAQRNQGGQGQQGGGLLDELMGLLGLGGRGRGRGAPRIPPAAGAGGAGLLASLGGFAKKLPLIGGLIAGAMTALGVLDSEADTTTTRREKDETAGKAIGGLGGMIAGGFAGAQGGAMLGAFAGPIGAAIGGVVGGVAGMFFGDQAGQIIGKTIGGWVNDLRTADIPGMIAGAWTSVTDTIKGTWDAALENIKTTFSGMAEGVMAVFDGVAKALGGAWDTLKNGAKVLTEGAAAMADKAKAALKDATGVDLDAVAKNVTDAAKAGVDAVKTGIVNVADKANTAVREATGVDVAAKAKEAWETLQEGADALKEKATGMVTGAVAGAKTVVNNTIEGANALGSAAVDTAKKGANYLANETTPGKIAKKAAEVTGKAVEAGKQQYKALTGQADDEMIAAFQAKGWTKEQAAGIAANLKQESGKTYNHQAVGDGGKAYGLAQWHPDRQADFKAWAGKDIREASKQEQIDFIDYELRQGKEKAAGQKLMQAQTAGEAGAAVSKYYERPLRKDEEAANRGTEAERMAAKAKIAPVASAPSPDGKSGIPPSDSSVPAKVSDTKTPAEPPKPLAFKPDANPQPAQSAQTAQAAPVAVQAPAVANLAPAVSVSMPASLGMIQSPAPPPVVSDAPAVAEPLGFGSNTATSGRSDGNSDAPLVGQDVKDRRIAHVVTGGLSNFV